MRDSWQVETANIERLRIVGPYSEGQACLAWLHENGYRTIRSGPYTDREMFPQADITRFLITAEREIEEAEPAPEWTPRPDFGEGMYAHHDGGLMNLRTRKCTLCGEVKSDELPG